MEECHKLLTTQIDLFNPEGHRIVPDISNPLPLEGPLVSENMTSVQLMVSHTGGLVERSSTSANTVSPQIVMQSDPICEFSVLSVSRLVVPFTEWIFAAYKG
ncbi:hypothetical protein Tco_0325233 [Tanacetum coccineum]